MNVIKRILKNWLFKSESPIIPSHGIPCVSDKYIMKKLYVSIEVDTRMSELDIEEEVCYMMAQELFKSAVITIDLNNTIDPYHTRRMYHTYVTKELIKDTDNLSGMEMYNTQRPTVDKTTTPPRSACE